MKNPGFARVTTLSILFSVLFSSHFFPTVLAETPEKVKEYDIEILNGSKGDQPQKIEKLNLLKLEGGMQVVRSFEKAGPSMTLAIPEDTKGFPYMLQGIYQGVRYNRMIPPNLPSNQRVRLRVYEVTKKYSNASLSVLYVVRYASERLRFLVLYKFNNQSGRTFIENGNGVHFFIPPQAENVDASVSVGSGLSNIEWLKIAPLPVREADGIFIVPYPLKPGERIYQIGYQLPYNGSSLSVLIRSEYPVSGATEILLENKDIDLLIPDQPDWSSSGQRKDPGNLSGNLITLPSQKTGPIRLVFRGGTPFKEDVSEAPPVKSIIKMVSPLSNAEKAIYPLLSCIVIAALFFYFQKTPAWLIQFWLRRKSLLEYQLARFLIKKAPHTLN